MKHPSHLASLSPDGHLHSFGWKSVKDLQRQCRLDLSGRSDGGRPNLASNYLSGHANPSSPSPLQAVPRPLTPASSATHPSTGFGTLNPLQAKLNPRKLRQISGSATTTFLSRLILTAAYAGLFLKISFCSTYYINCPLMMTDHMIFCVVDTLFASSFHSPNLLIALFSTTLSRIFIDRPSSHHRSTQGVS